MKLNSTPSLQCKSILTTKCSFTNITNNIDISYYSQNHVPALKMLLMKLTIYNSFHIENLQYTVRIFQNVTYGYQ